MPRIRLLCCFAFLCCALPGLAQAATLRPAIVYLSATDNDRGFINTARTGMEKASTEFRAPLKEFRASSADEIQNLIKKAADEGYSPIVALGYQNTIPVLNLAERYPDTRFTVIDGLVPPLYPNVQSILFKDHEGGFLVGLIAAKIAKSGRVGFIGGMDVPVIRNFQKGFEQGVHYGNPDIKVMSAMVGDDASAWSNAEKAHSLALEQFSDGAEVIFAAAGGSSVGVLKAASEAGKFGIGVDTNQNGLYPGHVLTSLVKRVDIAVYDTLKNSRNNQWNPGIKYLGIKEGALDYAVDENNRNLISEHLIDQVATAKERIGNGLIIVEPYQPK